MKGSIVDKLLTLALNRHWQPVGCKTVKDSIICMCSERVPGRKLDLALDICYPLKADGTPDFENPSSILPVAWDVWVTLPVENYHLSISTVHGEIRAPTVLICSNYDKMPIRRRSLTKSSLFDRDGGRCQYTGKHLLYSEATIDHVVPKSRGGKTAWANVVLADAKINAKKGNIMPQDFRMKLLRQPFEPRAVPACELIRNPSRVSDWDLFLKGKKALS